MEYTLEDKYRLIRAKALEQTSKNPIEIAKAIMHEDYVDIMDRSIIFLMERLS